MTGIGMNKIVPLKLTPGFTSTNINPNHSTSVVEPPHPNPTLLWGLMVLENTNNVGSI